MKRLGLVTLGLFIVVLAGIVVARIIGASRNEDTWPTIVRVNANKVSGVWCWQKICPGRSSIAEAKNAILASGGKLIIDYSDQLRADYPEGYTVVLGNNENKSVPVDQIQISFSNGANLGTLADVVLNFGTPNLVVYDRSRGYLIGQPDICFEGYLCAYVIGAQSRLDLDLRIKEMDFFSAKAQPSDIDKAWKGFTSIPSQ